MNKKPVNAQRALMFRLLCIGVVLYWLAELVIGYFKGGPDAPDLTLLIVAIVVLGGGAALVGYLTWKSWKLESEAAALSEEEADEPEALPEGEQDAE